MTDDQLNALWLRGIAIEAIARAVCLSASSIRSRIKRLRAKDPEAWPIRLATQHPRGSGRAKPHKRAPKRTLPPLASLSE